MNNRPTDAAVTDDAPPEYRFEFNGHEVERLVTVADDLAFLRALPREGLLSHTEVRLVAGTLRRLLIDGQLNSLMACAVGEKPKLIIEAIDIDTALSQWPPEWVRYGFAGGGTAAGAHHKGFLLFSVPKEEREPYGSLEDFLRAHPLPTAGTEKKFLLRDFLTSTSVAIKTDNLGVVPISRNRVLQYIANRKGGVHFDPKRDLGLKDVKKWRKEAEFHLLDHGLLRVGHLSGPEYEVQSMGEAISNADWATEIIKIAEEAAPADFNGNPNELKFWTGLQEADGTGWATSTFAAKPTYADDEDQQPT